MATDPQPAERAQPYGEVFDRGYQHYTGPRLGRGYAIRRLIFFSIRRGLGIKKKWTAKIIPFLLYLVSYAPALLIVAILAFVPADELTGLGVDSLYGVLETVILVFAAALAPEMLCDDRRERTLQLYFSRPLTQIDYLLAKVLAMGFLMSTVIFGPPMLLFLGLMLTSDSPGGYLVDNFSDILKITSYGALVSIYFAAIALSVSLFTVRKGVAAAILIIGVILTTAFSNAFFQAFDNTASGYLILLSPFDYIDGLRRWVFISDSQNAMMEAGNVPGVVLLLWLGVVVAGSMALMYRTYMREE